MSANAIDTVCVQNCTSEFLKKMFFMLINLGYFFLRHCIYRNNVCVACFDISIKNRSNSCLFSTDF